MARSTTAYVRYDWDCAHCGGVNDAGDIDPQGDTLTCDDCGEESYIRETR